MKLLLTYLLLASLCVLLSRGVSSQLVVTQSTDVTVEEGHTAEISCYWTDSNKTRVTWKKNENIYISERLENKSCSLLKLANITKADEGTYFCTVAVEIPILMKVSGNGTILTVKSKNGTEMNTHKEKDGNNAPSYILITLAVLAPVLLVTLIWFCCLRRKQAQAARVIYEVPHFDSETQEMDKHSTGSRGSSQWCQVPVYESFDYFEHTEAKKSG